MHNPANRRIRTRMSGGVGGEQEERLLPPIPIQWGLSAFDAERQWPL